eukprot:Clim_evm46s108 gene=Clim_evmTU46s108
MTEEQNTTTTTQVTPTAEKTETPTTTTVSENSKPASETTTAAEAPKTSENTSSQNEESQDIRDYIHGEKKPPCSYASLICLACVTNTGRRRTLADIYSWIQALFPYFATTPSGWQNSVRHNLSLNKNFTKIPKPGSTSGKGGFWTVDDKYESFIISNLKNGEGLVEFLKQFETPTAHPYSSRGKQNKEEAKKAEERKAAAASRDDKRKAAAKNAKKKAAKEAAAKKKAMLNAKKAQAAKKPDKTAKAKAKANAQKRKAKAAVSEPTADSMPILTDFFEMDKTDSALGTAEINFAEFSPTLSSINSPESLEFIGNEFPMIEDEPLQTDLDELFITDASETTHSSLTSDWQLHTARPGTDYFVTTDSVADEGVSLGLFDPAMSLLM